MEKWAPIRSDIGASYTQPSPAFIQGHQVFQHSYQALQNPREKLAQVIGYTLHDLEAIWNPAEPYNVKKHMFTVFPDGKMLPTFAATVDMYKRMIDTYVAWYKIPQQAMKEFWCQFIDCLLLCYKFEERANPEFKAWAYGRLCRYVLAERQQMRTTSVETYDPVNNFS